MTARRPMSRRGCSRSCARRTSGPRSSWLVGRSTAILRSPGASARKTRDRQPHLLPPSAVLLPDASPAPRRNRRAQAGHQPGHGCAPVYFRSPVGLRHPLLEPALEEASLTFVLWALRTYDTRALKTDALGRGSWTGSGRARFVLLHDRPGPGAEAMLTSLPGVIDRLRNGVRFVTLEGVSPGGAGPGAVAVSAHESRAQSSLRSTKRHRGSGGRPRQAARGRRHRRGRRVERRHRGGGRARRARRVFARAKPWQRVCAPPRLESIARSGYTHVLFLDADGQHRPEDVRGS